MLDRLFQLINEFLELRNQRKISLRECQNCRILSNLLENERRERLRLLEKPKEIESSSENYDYNPLKKDIPWSIRRQQLEQESRARNARTE